MKYLHPAKLSELIETHAKAELDSNKIGGKEIVIHQNGKPVYHGLFGYASANGTKLRKNMIFRAASMTKPLTAAVILHLWDRGAVDLERDVSYYYPAMKNLQIAVIENGEIRTTVPAKNSILVSDLLSHTGGVGCGPVDVLLPVKTNRMTQKEAIEIICRNPLAFEPRTNQSYSATDAFDLAAGIAETVSGMAYEDYLRQNIFEPLQMHDTTFSPTKEQRNRMVSMHDRTAEGKSVDAPMPENCVFEDYIPERKAAGAGIATTAEDYIRFADMLCQNGVSPDGTRVLSENAVKRMSTPNVPAEINMGCEQWGLGVRVIAEEGYPHGLGVGCFGWSGAYGTHFWIDPVNKLSVVMMKNSRYDGGAGNRSACELERDVCAALTE